MTTSDSWEVYERDNYQCRACGKGGSNILHEHHWEYRSQGGSDDISNRILLCAYCHEWFHSHPELLKVVVDETGYPHVFIRRR